MRDSGSDSDPESLKRWDLKSCVACGDLCARNAGDVWTHVHDSLKTRRHPAQIIELDHEERMTLYDWWSAFDEGQVPLVSLETLIEGMIATRLRKHGAQTGGLIQRRGVW